MGFTEQLQAMSNAIIAYESAAIELGESKDVFDEWKADAEKKLKRCREIALEHIGAAIAHTPIDAKKIARIEEKYR